MGEEAVLELCRQETIPEPAPQKAVKAELGAFDSPVKSEMLVKSETRPFDSTGAPPLAKAMEAEAPSTPPAKRAKYLENSPLQPKQLKRARSPVMKSEEGEEHEDALVGDLCPLDFANNAAADLVEEAASSRRARKKRETKGSHEEGSEAKDVEGNIWSRTIAWHLSKTSQGTQVCGSQGAL